MHINTSTHILQFTECLAKPTATIWIEIIWSIWYLRNYVVYNNTSYNLDRVSSDIKIKKLKLGYQVKKVSFWNLTSSFCWERECVCWWIGKTRLEGVCNKITSFWSCLAIFLWHFRKFDLYFVQRASHVWLVYNEEYLLIHAFYFYQCKYYRQFDLVIQNTTKK